MHCSVHTVPQCNLVSIAVSVSAQCQVSSTLAEAKQAKCLLATVEFWLLACSGRHASMQIARRATAQLQQCSWVAVCFTACIETHTRHLCAEALLGVLSDQTRNSTCLSQVCYSACKTVPQICRNTDVTIQTMLQICNDTAVGLCCTALYGSHVTLQQLLGFSRLRLAAKWLMAIAVTQCVLSLVCFCTPCMLLWCQLRCRNSWGLMTTRLSASC